MDLGVPRETQAGERRVALTPSSVKTLVQRKNRVWVESGAGSGAGHADADYESAGATIAFSRKEVYARANLVVGVQAPPPSDYELLLPGQAVVAFRGLPALRPDDIERLHAREVTAIGAEAIEDEHGRAPVLTGMSEMFSDGVVELFERGVVTNEAKTLHRGKTVASFVLGTRRTFDFLDNNPFVEFHPTDYVNDPFVIARNDRMVAINSALAVDLTGQVCADSLGRSVYSGVGGQVDFVRGAARSKGGKPVIALPSTARDGKVSRIVDTLAEGSGVVTTRGDVHFVVTEHGIARLFGKSLRERAQELIAVAHPDFREELRAAARRRHL
jgi:Acetyl-CoA hydrolase/transferase C-terminal domain/Alanine dehydrogenase/PNT, N-terminal domain